MSCVSHLPTHLRPRRIKVFSDGRQRPIDRNDRARAMVLADTIRLGRYFDTTPLFWLNLQTAHDLSKAQIANDYSGIAPRPRETEAAA